VREVVGFSARARWTAGRSAMLAQGIGWRKRKALTRGLGLSVGEGEGGDTLLG
jgi:hypothetical protein